MWIEPFIEGQRVWSSRRCVVGCIGDSGTVRHRSEPGVRSGAFRRAGLQDGRAFPWRARDGRGWARRCGGDLLHGGRRRRRLEDYGLRPELVERVGRVLRHRLHRCYSRGPLESTGGLCGYGLGRYPEQRDRGKGSLPIRRCGCDLDRHRTPRHGEDRSPDHPPQKLRSRVCRGAGSRLRAQSRPGGLSKPQRGRRLGPVLFTSDSVGAIDMEMHPTDPNTLGGFKRSLQRLDREELRWKWANVDGRIVRYVRGCVHQVARR